MLERQMSAPADFLRDQAQRTQRIPASVRVKQKLQIGPLVLMMVLLHVIYPSFPITPQVEVGRIMTFIGFIWSVGPMNCLALVNCESMRIYRLVALTLLCFCVHVFLYAMTDTISDLIFPDAADVADLYSGPRYVHQMLTYLTVRFPLGSCSIVRWVVWCVVSAVVFASTVWKEFLFRGIYLGSLRTRMPFWAANGTTALIYALAHEPLSLSPDGTVRLEMVGLSPLVMGALWYGYLYNKSNNLLITVVSQMLFNLSLLGLHFALNDPARS